MLKERLPYYLFVGSYFLAKPFHFFPSGGPQIAEFIALIFLFYLLVSGQLAQGLWENEVYFWLGAFVVYTGLTGFAWSALLGSLGPTRPFLIYSYNLVIVGFLIGLRQRLGREFYSVVFFATLASVTLQVLLCFYHVDTSQILQKQQLALPGARPRLFFHNPNQLGYWALLSGCVMLCANLKAKVGLTKELVALGLTGVLCVYSQSLASSLGFVCLTLVWIVSGKSLSLRAALTVVLAASIIIACTAPGRALLIRFSNLGIESSIQTGRGYGRMKRFPQLLFFGAGESDHYRFAETYKDEDGAVMLARFDNSPLEGHTGLYSGPAYTEEQISVLFATLRISQDQDLAPSAEELTDSEVRLTNRAVLFPGELNRLLYEVELPQGSGHSTIWVDSAHLARNWEEFAPPANAPKRRDTPTPFFRFKVRVNGGLLDVTFPKQKQNSATLRESVKVQVIESSPRTDTPSGTRFRVRVLEGSLRGNEGWVLDSQVRRLRGRDPVFASEIHSTIGNIFFSHGVLGLAFIGLALFKLQQRSGLSALSFLLPPLLYGLAHNGLRESLLWVLWAVIWSAQGDDSKRPVQDGLQ